VASLWTSANCSKTVSSTLHRSRPITAEISVCGVAKLSPQ